MKMTMVTPKSTSDRFSWVLSTALLSSWSRRARRPISARAQHEGRVAHKAHRLWDCSENPGRGLVDNSPLHETEVRKSVTQFAGLKCYPYCRLLKRKPVSSQGAEGFS